MKKYIISFATLFTCVFLQAGERRLEFKDPLSLQTLCLKMVARQEGRDLSLLSPALQEKVKLTREISDAFNGENPVEDIKPLLSDIHLLKAVFERIIPLKKRPFISLLRESPLYDNGAIKRGVGVFFFIEEKYLSFLVNKKMFDPIRFVIPLDDSASTATRIQINEESPLSPVYEFTECGYKFPVEKFQ
jgi:hypothetical protein